jgi:hypothetical protein
METCGSFKVIIIITGDKNVVPEVHKMENVDKSAYHAENNSRG